MKIGGFQKISLLDYPDRIACIVFTQGCVFRCKFCYNVDLLDPEKDSSVTEESFFSFLEKRKGLIDGVVITGGEPTIQADLFEFISKIKEKGYLVKLDTCGYFPKRLKNLLDKGVIDYLAMDVKATKEKYSDLVGIEVDTQLIIDSIRHIKNSKILHEFRTTVIDGIHKESDIIEIAQMIEGADLFLLQKYKTVSKVVNLDYQKKKAPPEEFLKEIALKCEKYVKKCEIR